MATPIEFCEPCNEAMQIIDVLEQRALNGVSPVSSTEVSQLISAIHQYENMFEEARALASVLLDDIYQSKGIAGLPRRKYKKGATVPWDRIDWVQRLEDLAGMTRGLDQDHLRKKQGKAEVECVLDTEKEES